MAKAVKTKVKDTSIRDSEGIKEKCGKCSSLDFSIGEDKNQRRYCSKCNNVWSPKTLLELKLQHAEEIIFSLRNKIEKLEEQLVLHNDIEKDISSDETGMFT